MQFLSIDLAYLPKDDKGYQYLLLIGDVVSKYVQAVSLKNQTAPTIVDSLLRHWIYIHGCPFYLLSDQGTNVGGEVMTAICNKLGIESADLRHIIARGMALLKGIYVLSRTYCVLHCYIVSFRKRNGAQYYLD